MKVSGKLTGIEILLLVAAAIFLAGVLVEYTRSAREAESRPWTVVTGRQVTDGGEEMQPGPLDLNTADREQLMSLPGIGEVLAGRILALRDERGGFSEVEELLDVDGIGEATLEGLRDCVTIQQEDSGGTSDPAEEKKT